MPRFLTLCAVLTISTATWSRTIEEFERQLRRPPPVATPFVEYRYSHLLKKPLRTSGMLEYRADGTLARLVDSPYRETTEVTGDQVRITRAGKPVRTLSLQRAPQLRVVLGSFRALLEGHLVPLQQDFELTLEEDASRWTLTLQPRDARLAKHLAWIDVFGSGDRPGCLEVMEPDGDGAITLLGEAPAADGKLPARADLERSCRAPPAQSAPAPSR